MLNLGRLKHVATALGLEEHAVRLVLEDFDENPESLVAELTLWPAEPDKAPRDVICMRRRWRLVQKRIYRKLLLHELRPTRYSHGGVHGRSPATNARSHIGNRFAFATDIKSFFPSISCSKVNRVFLKHGCGYSAARVLTRLCTYGFCPALGLTTSPILANEVAKSFEFRIALACQRMGLTYTRFYDDITISGPFDLERSGIEGTVAKILGSDGFSMSARKTRYGRLDRGFVIAGVRIKGDHLDASKEFIDELSRLVLDHASLAHDGPFDGPLLAESELLGKAHYACFLNRGRRRSILAAIKGIDWCALMNNAVKRGLCRYRSRLAPRGHARPNPAEPLALAAGHTCLRGIQNIAPLDRDLAPWEVSTPP